MSRYGGWGWDPSYFRKYENKGRSRRRPDPRAQAAQRIAQLVAYKRRQRAGLTRRNRA